MLIRLKDMRADREEESSEERAQGMAHVVFVVYRFSREKLIRKTKAIPKR